MTTSKNELSSRVTIRKVGPETSARPENTPMNIAIPPMIGMSPIVGLASARPVNQVNTLGQGPKGEHECDSDRESHDH